MSGKRRKHHSHTSGDTRKSRDTPPKYDPSSTDNDTTGNASISMPAPNLEDTRDSYAARDVESNTRGGDMSLEDMKALCDSNVADEAIRIVQSANKKFVTKISKMLKEYVRTVQSEKQRVMQEVIDSGPGSSHRMSFGLSQSDDPVQNILNRWNIQSDSAKYESDGSLNNNSQDLKSIGSMGRYNKSESTRRDSSTRDVFDITQEEEEEYNGLSEDPVTAPAQTLTTSPIPAPAAAPVPASGSIEMNDDPTFSDQVNGSEFSENDLPPSDTIQPSKKRRTVVLNFDDDMNDNDDDRFSGLL